MSKLRALDLFCCAGGAGMGLHRAGFEVVGVDIRPQPRYPFEFHQGDALEFPTTGFDFIWASPPCQAHTAMKTMHNAKEHADLIPQTREKLNKTGALWCIENVRGADTLNTHIMLCGTMFGLGVEDADLLRHRDFEANFPIIFTPPCQHGARATIGVYGGHVRNRKRTIGVYGEGARDSRRKLDKGVPDFSVEQGREAMGIDWMTIAELSQAIPPAYSEYIGREAIRQINSDAGAVAIARALGVIA